MTTYKINLQIKIKQQLNNHYITMKKMMSQSKASILLQKNENQL